MISSYDEIYSKASTIDSVNPKNFWINKSISTNSWTDSKYSNHQKWSLKYLLETKVVSHSTNILELGSGNDFIGASLAYYFPDKNITISDLVIPARVHSCHREIKNLTYLTLDSYNCCHQDFTYDLIFAFGCESILSHPRTLSNFQDIHGDPIFITDFVSHISPSNLISPTNWLRFFRYLSFLFKSTFNKTYLSLLKSKIYKVQSHWDFIVFDDILKSLL